MTAQEKLTKAAEMLAAVGVTTRRNTWTDGGGKLIATVQGRTVEIEVTGDGAVTTSKYAYLLPDNLFILVEAL